MTGSGPVCVRDEIMSDHGVAEVGDPLQGRPDIPVQTRAQVDRAARAVRVQPVFVGEIQGGLCQLQGYEGGVVG